MLKIFALPFTSKMWIEKLILWRKKIISARGAIANINPDAIDKELAIKEEDDKVLKELGLQSETVDFMVNLLQNGTKTKTVIVLNEDSLSLNESKRIKEGLNFMKIPLNMVLINKFGMIGQSSNINEVFNNIPLSYANFFKKGKLSKDEMIESASNWSKELINE
jgi:arsenite-transporting ATPase